MIGYEKITRRQFYDTWGGFSNPRCVRVQRGRGWSYYLRRAV